MRSRPSRQERLQTLAEGPAAVWTAGPRRSILRSISSRRPLYARLCSRIRVESRGAAERSPVGRRREPDSSRQEPDPTWGPIRKKRLRRPRPTGKSCARARRGARARAGEPRVESPRGVPVGPTAFVSPPPSRAPVVAARARLPRARSPSTRSFARRARSTRSQSARRRSFSAAPSGTTSCS